MTISVNGLSTRSKLTTLASAGRRTREKTQSHPRSALERSGGAGYPAGLEHFAIAETWGCSPAEVLDWDTEMVEDAMQITRARSRYAERTKGRTNGG